MCLLDQLNRAKRIELRHLDEDRYLARKRNKLYRNKKRSERIRNAPGNRNDTRVSEDSNAFQGDVPEVERDKDGESSMDERSAVDNPRAHVKKAVERARDYLHSIGGE